MNASAPLPNRETVYWVAFDLPEHVRAEAERLRRVLACELGIKSSNAPPHITLKCPFTTELLTGRRSRTSIEEVMRSIPHEFLNPVEIKFGSLQKFNNGEKEKVIYLPVVSEQLKTRCEQILRWFGMFGLPKQDYDGRVMHLTLASYLNEDSFGPAWETLSQHRLASVSCMIESMTLYREVDGFSHPVEQYLFVH